MCGEVLHHLSSVINKQIKKTIQGANVIAPGKHVSSILMVLPPITSTTQKTKGLMVTKLKA